MILIFDVDILFINFSVFFGLHVMIKLPEDINPSGSKFNFLHIISVSFFIFLEVI